MRAYNLMRQAFPKEVEASRLTLALERDDGPLTNADFAIVDQIIKAVEESLRDSTPELKLSKISSYQDGIVGQRMTSHDGHCTLVQVSLDTPPPGGRHPDHRRPHRTLHPGKNRRRYSRKMA